MITGRTLTLLIGSVMATIAMLFLLHAAKKPCAVPHSSLVQASGPSLLRVQDEVDELPHLPMPCQKDEGMTSPEQLSVLLCVTLWVGTVASLLNDAVLWRAERKRRRHQRRRSHRTSSGPRTPEPVLEETPRPIP